MYYYIFDTKKFSRKTQIEALKDHLAFLGISGEFSYINPAQTAEDLAEIGIQKGYSTIVAVGGDEVINSVVNSVIGRKEAMGVIPIGASSGILSLIKVSGWKDGAESLRYRRIRELYAGRTATGQHFLTHVLLDIKKPFEVTIEFKNYLVQALAKNLIISNYHPQIEKFDEEYLDVVMESEAKGSDSVIDQLTHFFRTPSQKARSLSVFRARSLRLFTKKPMPILADEKMLAKTPQLIETTDEKLRLIVSRA